MVIPCVKGLQEENTPMEPLFGCGRRFNRACSHKQKLAGVVAVILAEAETVGQEGSAASAELV